MGRKRPATLATIAAADKFTWARLNTHCLGRHPGNRPVPVLPQRLKAKHISEQSRRSKDLQSVTARRSEPGCCHSGRGGISFHYPIAGSQQHTCENRCSSQELSLPRAGRQRSVSGCRNCNALTETVAFFHTGARESRRASR